MKRFFSYLLLCFSILFSVFVCFEPVFSEVNASSDFDEGREYYYQISLKDSSDFINNNDTFITDGEIDKQIDKVIDEMKDRLDKSDVTKAVVEKMSDSDNGVYTIRVAYKAQYPQMYALINDYLTFDRNLSVSIIEGSESKNFEQYADDGKEQLFKLGKAELVPAKNPHSQNPEDIFPTIKLPLADSRFFNEEIYEKVNPKEDNGDGTKSLISPKYEGETEEDVPETKPSDYIYIVNNWKNEYNLEKAAEAKYGQGAEGAAPTPYLTEATNSIVFAFNAKDPDSMFFEYNADDSTKNAFLKIPYTMYSADYTTTADPSTQLRIINKSAELALNKFNATPYKLDVKLLNVTYPHGATNEVAPFVEPILERYGKLAVSSLLIATIASVVLVTLFMALSYGINAITGLTVGSAVTLLSAGMLSIFGVEFNIGTIVALVAVAIVSIFSSCIYFKSIRENAYTGKNLKKANAEASKKTALYHIDISVIMVILGVVGYVMQNSVIMSIGAVLICGGIFNFIFNFVALRGLTWLLANSTFIEKHLNVMKIDKKFIPDLLNDEKPTYFEPLKKQKSNKTRNIVVAAVTGALLLGSVIAIPTVLATKGDIYGKASSTTLNSQIQITYKIKADDTSADEFKEKLNEVLGRIYTVTLDENGTEVKGEVIKYNEETIKGMYFSEVNKDNNTDNTFTYIIELDEVIKDRTKQYAYLLNPEDKIEGATDLVDLLKSKLGDYVSSPEIYIMDAMNYSDDFLNYNILIYAVISIAIATAYILLRFGLGKALISLVAVGGISTISVGVFSMLQVGLTSANTLAVVIIALVGYAILLHYFTRERSLIKEHKGKIKDADAKAELLRLSNNLSFETALSSVALSFLVIVSFLLSKSFSQGIVLITALGVLLFILFVQALVLPMDNIDKKLWSKTKEVCNFDKISFKKGDKKKKKHSDGPQEATFIGIND